MLRLFLCTTITVVVFAINKPQQFQVGVESKPDPVLRPTNLLPRGVLKPYKQRTFQIEAPTIDRTVRAPAHNGRAKRDVGKITELRAQGVPLYGKRQAYDQFFGPAPAPAPPPVYVPPSRVPSRPRPIQRRPVYNKPAYKRPPPSYYEPMPPQPPPPPPPQYYQNGGVSGSQRAQYQDEQFFNPAPQQVQQPQQFRPQPPPVHVEATRYYYPPRFPLPLAKCFHNPTGYVCCNPELNDLMVQTFTDLEARPKFHTCNIQKLANELQERAQTKFNETFETVASFEDFAQKIHFKGDLVCKVELGGRYMLAYSSVPGVNEANLPPVDGHPQMGPIPENHISRRNSVRMYPKGPQPIRSKREVKKN